MKISFLKLLLPFYLIFYLLGCDNSFVPGPEPDVKIYDTEPDWSYDGKAIVYRHSAQNNVEAQEGIYQIRVLDLESLKSRFLTEGFNPKWSPDDKYVAYMWQENIYKINVATGVKQQLVYHESYSPSWSPDGKRITFDSNHNDPNGANVIWIVNSDGTGLKDISIHGTGEWKAPNWSPDGSKILYTRFFENNGGLPELFIMDTLGQNNFRLTFNEYEDWHTSWTKNGSKIAWNSGYSTSLKPGEGNSGIWVMNTDGTEATLLINDGYIPSWSPSGEEIVYRGKIPGTNIETLWIKNLNNGNRRQLFNY